MGQEIFYSSRIFGMHQLISTDFALLTLGFRKDLRGNLHIVISMVYSVETTTR